MMKTFLAIDFGTTQSSVAVITENSTREPQVIEINDGQRVVKAIATAMQLDITGHIAYFGAKALSKSEDAPERTFQNFKVFVGSKENTYQQKTAQYQYTPDKLAALFLNHLRELIEEHYFNGTKLSSIAELSCVIGCPSDWDEVRKENLKNIASSAGFPNIKLCDEAIGVIYYNHFFGGLKLRKSQKILVYDFGGGTTDVAIARINMSDTGKIEPSVLAVGGIPNLGGSNFDEAITAHYLSENHYDLSSLTPKEKLHDRWVIGLAAREAKEELSHKKSVEKTINRLKSTGGQKPQKLSLSREGFMSVCRELVAKFDEPIFDALTYAGLSEDNIDFVVLAGGSSAMPYVKESMSRIFPAEKIFMSPSTEVIAQGLAVYGKAEASAKTFTASKANANDEKTLPAVIEPVSIRYDDDDDEDDVPFIKKYKGWFIGVAAVLVIGWVFMYGYPMFMEYRDNAEKLKAQAALEQARNEQLKLQAQLEQARREKEQAEQQRLQAERAKAEEQRRLQAQMEEQRRQQQLQAQQKSSEGESEGMSSTAKGAIAGAAIGSFIPGIGTIAGGLIGAGAGWLFGD